ncbi:MAG: EAL domain-containing protein [Pseudomonadota bacterium]
MTSHAKHKYRSLEDFASIATEWFWETDAAHRFTYFSDRLEEETKVPPSKFLGRRRDTIPEDSVDDPKWIKHLEDLNAHRPFRNFEYVIRRPTDHAPLWVRVSGQPLFDDDGAFMGYRGSAHNVTDEMIALKSLEASHAALEERNKELDEARKALERAAFSDPLTELPNRRAFARDLKAALDQPTSQVGLLHVDLDRFKWVNDTLGHPAGDAVLVCAAARIRNVVTETGAVYRVGGDEFMIILTHDVTEELANWLGDAIVDAMFEPIEHDQQRASVGASVGIAFGEPGRFTAAQLIANADVALYEAKRSGRNTVRQITPCMQERMQAHRSLVAEIPRALENGEFIPFFQPQVDIRTGAVVGAEALARWHHPEHGILPPGAFLNAAAELGQVAAIDHIMLEQALAAAERINQHRLILPSVSVNISAARLMDPHLTLDVARLWRDRRCKLCIELLETIYFEEPQDVAQFTENLQELRDMGVRIETDDFGSGRASITGLLKILPDRVKIDRSLIQAAVKDPVKRNVVAAILDMIRGLGIEGLAEGVECQADIETIRALGCNIFQGYALSRPLDEAKLAAHLKAQQPLIRAAGQ